MLFNQILTYFWFFFLKVVNENQIGYYYKQVLMSGS